MLTDQGTNFTSQLFQKICKLFNIKKIQTTPYHPQTNGALERHHKTLVDYIKIFSKANPSNWDELLTYAMCIHNNTPNSATKIAPNDCIFGYISEMPKSLKSNPGIRYNFDCNYQNIRHELHKVWTWVRKNQKEYKEKTKQYYDRKSREKGFNIGDKVFVQNEAKSNKLCPLWVGPFEVLEIKSPVNTIVKIRGKIKTVHNNRLKLYHSREQEVEFE